VDWKPLHWLKFVESLYLNRRQPRFSRICWRSRMIISAKRQYQDTASIRDPVTAVRNFAASCRPDLRDPKLVAHHNRRCLSYFRSIDEGTRHRSRASASAQSSSEADCHWERMATQSQQSLAHKKWYRSLRFKCNGLLHSNRGLPESTVYDLSTVGQPEVRGEISPRIKCSSLRFKCNRMVPSD